LLELDFGLETVQFLLKTARSDLGGIVCHGCDLREEVILDHRYIFPCLYYILSGKQLQEYGIEPKFLLFFQASLRIEYSPNLICWLAIPGIGGERYGFIYIKIVMYLDGNIFKPVSRLKVMK
jgi:hypothetical protein